MPRKRRTRKPEPKPPGGRDLKARAEALSLAADAVLTAARARVHNARASAIEAATARGDRVAGFVGPVADAGGTVAAQTEEEP